MEEIDKPVVIKPCPDCGQATKSTITETTLFGHPVKVLCKGCAGKEVWPT